MSAQAHEDPPGCVGTTAAPISTPEDIGPALEQISPEPISESNAETKPKNGGAEQTRESAMQAGWSEIASRVKTYNTQKIQYCNEDIDTLLVFAGIFSGVLTAFNIESYKQLLPDPNAATVVLLGQIARQLNNSLAADDLVQAFQTSSGPDTTSVRINSLWFASLLLSLITAALAILVKQWLRQFTASDVQDDAKEYCYRHWGLARYQVYGIADFLPMMLQASLALFLVGFVYFAWSLNRTVAIITTTLAALWFAAYLSTIVACIADPVCPYRTPFITIMIRYIKNVVFYAVLLLMASSAVALFILLDVFAACLPLGRKISSDMQFVVRRWRTAADNLGLLRLRTPFKLSVPDDSRFNMSLLSAAFATVQDLSLLDPIKHCLQLDPPSYAHIVQTTELVRKLHFSLGISKPVLTPLTQYIYDGFQFMLKHEGPPNRKERKAILGTMEDNFNQKHRYGDLLNVVFSQDDDFLDYETIKVLLWDCFNDVQHLDETCVVPTTREALANLVRRVPQVMQGKAPYKLSKFCPTILFMILHAEEHTRAEHLDEIRILLLRLTISWTGDVTKLIPKWESFLIFPSLLLIERLLAAMPEEAEYLLPLKMVLEGIRDREQPPGVAHLEELMMHRLSSRPVPDHSVDYGVLSPMMSIVTPLSS